MYPKDSGPGFSFWYFLPILGQVKPWNTSDKQYCYISQGKEVKQMYRFTCPWEMISTFTNYIGHCLLLFFISPNFCRLAGTLLPVGCHAWTSLPDMTVPHWRVLLPCRFWNELKSNLFLVSESSSAWYNILNYLH